MDFEKIKTVRTFVCIFNGLKMNFMKVYYRIGLAICCLFFTCCKMNTSQENYTLFVGTYTNNGSEGIYRYTFDSETGQLTTKTLIAKAKNPSYLKISPNRKTLYAVNETNENGSITAFEIQEDSIIKLNTESTLGGHPCHIGVSDDGGLVAISNYGGGSVSIFNTNENGALESGPLFIDHTVLDSTKTSHAHSAQFTSEGLFVADLGLDAIKRYQLENGEIVPSGQPSLDMAEKSGPRHFTFGQNGTFIYVINELNSTISVLQKSKNQEYKIVETQSTLATDFNGESFCADIHLSEDGKFLYGSNRGENTIVIFKVDDQSGKLTLVGRESVRGDWPRNFSLDPTGNFLLVANQRSNNIVMFKRDIKMGTLEYLQETELPSPVCLEFL